MPGTPLPKLRLCRETVRRLTDISPQQPVTGDTALCGPTRVTCEETQTF